MSQVGTDNHRERGLGGTGSPRDVGVARGVHRDAVRGIAPVAADVAGVDERRAGRIDLGHEGVEIAGAVVSEIGADRLRERSFVGKRGPGNVGAARGIHRNGAAKFGIAAANEARVNEHSGIEHERPGSVVVTKLEFVAARSTRGLARFHVIDRVNLRAAPFDLLIRIGLIVPESSRGGFDLELAGCVRPDRCRAAIRQPDLVRVGAGLYEEGVLETVRCSGVNEIDPGPEVGIDDRAIGLQTGLPVFFRTLEVADDGSGLLLAREFHVRVRAHEIELHRPALERVCRVLTPLRKRCRPKTGSGVLARLLPGQRERDAFFGEVDRFVAALDVIGHAGIDLAAVLDEVQRHLPEPGDEPRVPGDAARRRRTGSGRTGFRGSFGPPDILLRRTKYGYTQKGCND